MPSGVSIASADQNLARAIEELNRESAEARHHLCYSITSSARASIDGGKARPRALAVLRFTMKSNLAGCSTGRSAGFAPRKILSTYSAARRYKSAKFGP